MPKIQVLKNGTYFIYLPKALVDFKGLHHGDEVTFTEHEKGILLVRSDENVGNTGKPGAGDKGQQR